MTATMALPRTTQPHSDWLAKLRTIGLGLGGRGVMGVGLGRSAVSAAEASWWLAGGAPTPVAVYQPKGAASLAASYVNLANPGTYDAAPGVAPTLDASGWMFRGAEWLDSGVDLGTAGVVISMLLRFSGVSINSYTGSYAPPAYAMFYPRNGTNRTYGNGSFASKSGAQTAGVMAIAGSRAYLNGVDEGIVLSDQIEFANIPTLVIGALRRNDGVIPLFFNGNIQAVAIWLTSTNHATWMPAVSAAVALI